MDKPPEYGIRVSVSRDQDRAEIDGEMKDKLRDLGLYIQNVEHGKVHGLIEPDRLETLEATPGIKVQINEDFMLDPKEWGAG